MAVHIIACVELPATAPAGHRITKDYPTGRSALVILIHPISVVAPQERFPPPGVGQVPLELCAQAACKIACRRVTQLVLRLGVVDGIAPVMSEAVAHKIGR